MLKLAHWTPVRYTLALITMAAQSQTAPAGKGNFEFQTKPPAIAVKEAAGTVKKIPLLAPMLQYSKLSVAGQPHDVLYVLHTAAKKSQAAAVSVVDLNTQTVRKVIPVGAGLTMKLALFDNDKAYVYSTGNQLSKPKPGQGTRISVIDTAQDQIIANYFWDGIFAERVELSLEAFGSAPTDIPMAGKATRFFLVSGGRWEKGKSDGKTVLVMTRQDIAMFTGTTTTPTWVSRTDLSVLATASSLDSRYLIVAGHREIGRWFSTPDTTTLSTIDQGTGTFTQHNINIANLNKLVRLGDTRDLWALGSSGMLRVSERGDPVGQTIPFDFKGSPGDLTLVGKDKVAVLVNKGNVFDHRVALIDLTQLKLIGTFETRDSGKSSRKTFGRYLGAFALSMATMGTVVFMPNSGYPYSKAMASRPDGAFLYVYDAYTHEVTVIDTSQGRVSVRIPVNSGTVAVQVSHEGKELHCLGVGEVVDRIDMHSNSKL